MNQIKKVVLKDATKLSQEEMKNVFGGSGSESGSGCGLLCGNKPFVKSIQQCPRGCDVVDNTLTCSGTNSVATYVCSNGLITSSVVTIDPPN